MKREQNKSINLSFASRIFTETKNVLNIIHVRSEDFSFVVINNGQQCAGMCMCNSKPIYIDKNRFYNISIALPPRSIAKWGQRLHFPFFEPSFHFILSNLKRVLCCIYRLAAIVYFTHTLPLSVNKSSTSLCIFIFRQRLFLRKMLYADESDIANGWRTESNYVDASKQKRMEYTISEKKKKNSEKHKIVY